MYMLFNEVNSNSPRGDLPIVLANSTAFIIKIQPCRVIRFGNLGFSSNEITRKSEPIILPAFWIVNLITKYCGH